MAKKFKSEQYEWSEPGQLMIPRIGSLIELTEDWTFRLYSESRNSKLFDLFGLKMRKEPYNVTLFAGVVLKVARIYIKQESRPDSHGMNAGGEYNSLTFTMFHVTDDMVMIDALSGEKTVLHGGGKPRFWSKLADVNKIKGRIALDTLAKF